MKLVTFSIAVALLLSACTTTQPRHAAPTDRVAFDAIQTRYASCLGAKSAEYIHGSDDVALLTTHVMSLCEPVLADLNREILARGFSQAYSNGYVSASRKEGKQMTVSGILKMKSGEMP